MRMRSLPASRAGAAARSCSASVHLATHPASAALAQSAPCILSDERNAAPGSPVAQHPSCKPCGRSGAHRPARLLHSLWRHSFPFPICCSISFSYATPAAARLLHALCVRQQRCVHWPAACTLCGGSCACAGAAVKASNHHLATPG